MLSSEQKLAYTLLWCIDQTPGNNLMQIWIFIHHNYVFIHLVTIMIQKNLSRVIQFQFFYVHFSPHYSIQSIIVMQWNKQPVRRKHVPRPCNCVSKMFLTPKSFKKLPVTTLIQIHALNIHKAAIITCQVGKKYGVMKPIMWMTFHQFNSG